MIKKKFLPALLFFSGVILITWVSFPIVSYKIWEIVNLQGTKVLVSPEVPSQTILGISVRNDGNFPSLVSDLKRSVPAPYQTFSISIPKLKISEAKVFVDSNNLDKGLAHLPASALPGERGNIFISGHSSIFFNDNFSQLMKLTEGDKIELKVGETKMEYQVLGIKIVSPTDLSMVNPPNSLGRYLSLMTCVPPGLNIKRLVVLAELI